MGEAILFALDAPRVKRREGARALIERWDGRNDGPVNAKLEAFVRDVSEAWSGVGERGLWYEGEPHLPVNGPVLQIDLDHAVLDEQALVRLRGLAGRNSLHLLDPEGDVLYLADGSEESAQTADAKRGPPLIPVGEMCSPEGLRFDGVYFHRGPGGHSFYRFSAEGRVFRLARTNPDPKQAFLSLFEADSFVAKGKYKIDAAGHFQARIKASYAAFHIDGQVKEETLEITSVREDGNYRSTSVYYFHPVR